MKHSTAAYIILQSTGAAMLLLSLYYAPQERNWAMLFGVIGGSGFGIMTLLARIVFIKMRENEKE